MGEIAEKLLFKDFFLLLEFLNSFLLYLVYDKMGMRRLGTIAKTILVPPTEPGRRHQVWRRGPNLNNQ